jgi:hypothetical protein
MEQKFVKMCRLLNCGGEIFGGGWSVKSRGIVVNPNFVAPPDIISSPVYVLMQIGKVLSRVSIINPSFGYP